MTFLVDNLETERLLFKRLTHSYYDQWLEFFKDPSSTEFVLPPGNPEAQCREWIERQLGRYENGNGLFALIYKSTGRMVGQCGLLKQEVDGMQEIEIGYHILPAYRGKGFATEAAIACRNYAFEHGLTDSVVSLIHINNFRSQAVARRNGMAPEKQVEHRSWPAYLFRINQSK